MKKMIGVIAALAAVFLMAGCSAPSISVPDGQLACADALDEIKTMSASYQAAMTKVYSDPMAAATEFDAMAKKLKTASSTVNNTKMAEAFTKMAAASTKMATELRKTDGDIAEIGSTDFTGASAAFADALSSAATVCNS